MNEAIIARYTSHDMGHISAEEWHLVLRYFREIGESDGLAMQGDDRRHGAVYGAMNAAWTARGMSSKNDARFSAYHDAFERAATRRLAR